MTRSRRTILGIVVAVSVAVLLGLLSELALHAFPALPPIASSIKSVLITFFAIGVGAFFAQGRFLIPAASIVFAAWCIAIYILYDIALPAGSANLFEIALSNLPGLFLSLVAAAAGAIVGTWTYGRRITSTAGAS